MQYIVMTYTVLVILMILIHKVNVSSMLVLRPLSGVSLWPAREYAPVGMNMLKQVEMTLCFGTIYGYNVGVPHQVQWPILDDLPGQDIIKLSIYSNPKKNNSEQKKMANAFMSGNQRDFWDEVKHIDNQCNAMPKWVDDKQGDQNISNVFAEKYKDLYKCVSYDRCKMHDVCESLNQGIQSRCETGLCHD